MPDREVNAEPRVSDEKEAWVGRPSVGWTLFTVLALMLELIGPRSVWGLVIIGFCDGVWFERWYQYLTSPNRRRSSR